MAKTYRYKALILYGSVTGNTEMVAKTFAEVFEEFHIQPQLERIYPARKWDENPVYFDDYDIICFGAPIIAALPYHEVNLVLGAQGKRINFMRPKAGETLNHLGKPNMTPKVSGRSEAGERPKYGIAFTTYGGAMRGPSECRATLETLKEYMVCHSIKAVGEFACAGKEVSHTSVDDLNIVLGVNLHKAQEILQEFKEDPANPKWGDLGRTKIEALRKAAGLSDSESLGFENVVGNDPLGMGKPGNIFWHYDLQNRPNARDLQKARIFLEELLEDYFLTADGIPRDPISLYSCIG